MYEPVRASSFCCATEVSAVYTCSNLSDAIRYQVIGNLGIGGHGPSVLMATAVRARTNLRGWLVEEGIRSYARRVLLLVVFLNLVDCVL